MQVCPACKSFPKTDTLHIPSLKCSKSGLKEEKNCNECTIQVHQLNQVKHMHKGKEKKKLELLDNMIKDIINPYSCLLKNANFSVKTTND